MEKHYLDTDGYSTIKGNLCEYEYELKLIKKSIPHRKANRFEQKLHWDFILSGTHKIEVKSSKAKNKYQEPAYDEIVLELHGYQPYNNGWLKGQADYIAFQQKDGSFIHFKRGQLLEWIQKELLNKHGDISIQKNWSEEIKDYQLYFRPGNHLEEFCYVPLKDIPLKSVTFWS